MVHTNHARRRRSEREGSNTANTKDRDADRDRGTEIAERRGKKVDGDKSAAKERESEIAATTFPEPVLVAIVVSYAIAFSDDYLTDRLYENQ